LEENKGKMTLLKQAAGVVLGLLQLMAKKSTVK
jgi:hypothetical protein